MDAYPIITWKFETGIVRSNPKIAGGAALVDGCGISAETLIFAIGVEGGIEQAAKAYGVEVRHLMLAREYVEFMDRVAAMEAT